MPGIAIILETIEIIVIILVRHHVLVSDPDLEIITIITSLSSENEPKKKVTYADATRSSLDQSVHNPNNCNSKGKNAAYQYDKPALDRSAFEKIVTTVTAFNKNFDTLQNNYKQWKLKLQQMNQRIFTG